MRTDWSNQREERERNIGKMGRGFQNRELFFNIIAEPIIFYSQPIALLMISESPGNSNPAFLFNG